MQEALLLIPRVNGNGNLFIFFDEQQRKIEQEREQLEQKMLQEKRRNPRFDCKETLEQLEEMEGELKEIRSQKRDIRRMIFNTICESYKQDSRESLELEKEKESDQAFKKQKK